MIERTTTAVMSPARIGAAGLILTTWLVHAYSVAA
jgi:hypothetical protein